MGRDTELLLLKHLDRFFHDKNEGIIESTVIPIIEEESFISLRFIENFITKYCRENPVFIKSKKYLPKIRWISIYDDYRNQLTSYDKRRFDPFKRNHSSGIKIKEPENHLIFYPVDKNATKMILTTVGQLNFFRWLIETGILDYIKENYVQIKEKTALFKRKLGGKIDITQYTGSTTKTRKSKTI